MLYDYIKDAFLLASTQKGTRIRCSAILGREISSTCLYFDDCCLYFEIKRCVYGVHEAPREFNKLLDNMRHWIFEK